MTLTKSPHAGRSTAFFTVLSFAFAVTACAPKKEAVDTWQMEPPTLEATNAQGVSFHMKSSEFMKSTGADSTLMVTEAAALKFATNDQGLTLKTKSQCTSTTGTKLDHQLTTKTAEQVALLTLLPPTILSPEALKQEWSCALQLKVENAVGSSHQFAFNNVKMNLTASVARLNSGLVMAAEDEIKIRGEFSRRLVCSSWWVESLEADLNTMARKTKVSGVDSRESDRQPLCTVLELSSKPTLVGFFRPAFANPKLVLSREILVPRSDVPNLFNRSILNWNFRSEDANSQIVHVRYKAARVRFSLLRNGGCNPAIWTRPLLASPVLTVQNAAEVRETDSGVFFRINPGQVVTVQMQSARPAVAASRANFSHPCGHTMMAITTEQPIAMTTISNGKTVPPLATADVARLEQMPRDTFRADKDTLLGTLFLDNATALPVLRETPLTISEASRLGAQAVDADAFDQTKNLAEPAE